MLNALIDFIPKALRRIVLDCLRFRKLGDTWLRYFPLVRSLPETGLTYRMSSLGSIGVAREIFHHGEYNAIRPLLRDVRTVADLGCNCGFFSCFVANEARNLAIRGLLVDANPRMVREAQWHLKKNRLSKMRALHGVVGANRETGNEVFYLCPDAAGSSRFPSGPAGNAIRTSWEPIEVPVLCVAEEWRKHFGDAPCDLLKIDIEGSEGDFIRREADFTASVRFVLIEIHRWLVDANVIKNQLAALGFESSQSLCSSRDADLRFYINRQHRSPRSISIASMKAPSAYPIAAEKERRINATERSAAPVESRC